MERIVILVLVLMLLLTGCDEVSDTEEPFYTVERLEGLHDKLETIFQYKDAFFMQIQVDKEEGPRIVEQLKKCSDVATGLSHEGHTELSEVFDALGLAGANFELYLETGKMEYYAKGVTYYHNAEIIYRDKR